MSQQCIQQVVGHNTKYTNKIFYVRCKVKLIKVHVKLKKKILLYRDGIIEKSICN